MSAALGGVRSNIYRWLEIEGLPNAYGNVAQDITFFANRPIVGQHLSIKPWLTEIPQGVSAELDTKEGIASSVGQQEFSIVDFDGSLTQYAAVGTTNMCYLSADLTSTATSLTVTGTVPPSLATNGGSLYIGTETLHYATYTPATKTFTGITRGYYGSRAQDFGVGFPVSSQPYTMAKRRAWYYVLAYDPNSTPLDANKALVMSGTIEDIKLSDSDLNVFVITIESFERQINRDCFTTLRILRDTSNIGITDAQGHAPGVGLNSAPFPSQDLNDYYLGENFYVRVDDEIIHFWRNDSPGGAAPDGFYIVARGCFNTEIVKHDPGWTGQEVVGVVANDTVDFTSETTGSAFQSIPTSDAPLRSDHPLMILLQVLLSTGKGTNYVAGKRIYDVLPFGWGMGIDVDRVDVLGIEQAALQTPELRFGGIIDSSQNFPEFAKNLLAPLGYFGVTLVGDLWTVRYLTPPLPDALVRTINENNLISGTAPVWSANVQGCVQQVVYQFEKDIIADNYNHIHVEIFDDALVYTKGEGKILSYEMPLCYPAGSQVPGAPHSPGINVDSFLLRRSDFYRQRYSRPPPLIAVVVDYSYIDLEPGDLVYLSHQNLPDPVSGTRGIANAVCEVVSKSLDERAKVVNLTLLMTGYQVTKYRYIGTGLELQTVTSTTNITAKANSFTLPTYVKKDGTSWPQTDVLVYGGDENQHAAFYTGQPVAVVDPNFNLRGNTTINTFNTSTRVVTLGSAVSGMQIGDYIIPRAFSTQSALLYSNLYAFAGATPDNRFFP